MSAPSPASPAQVCPDDQTQPLCVGSAPPRLTHRQQGATLQTYICCSITLVATFSGPSMLCCLLTQLLRTARLLTCRGAAAQRLLLLLLLWGGHKVGVLQRLCCSRPVLRVPVQQPLQQPHSQGPLQAHPQRVALLQQLQQRLLCAAPRHQQASLAGGFSAGALAVLLLACLR